ncbi:MAG: phosphoribosylaminoimidazolesuccinocarboxamide synthase [Rhodothermales bacterium]|nr:phosphoribosylaminoimidazolesuccinocarboxamide synthase [Rhodothermales bacterium]
MLDDVIRRQLAATLPGTRFDGLGKRYGGKVRDTYALDEKLFLVTTDRISAFDHILRQTIPFKGQVLNRLAAYSFEKTADVVENHVIEVPDANVTVAHRCEPVPVEFVVRGYLAGHAWRTYRDGGRMLCGETLPDGLRQNSRLPNPILTPATKAEEGHDEDISAADIVRQGILSQGVLDRLTGYALALFQRGTEIAAERGLILVDTKYEFGKRSNGTYVVIDEIHTPDSSRYFHADTYEELLGQDRPQRQLSKEFVREWLMAHGFQGLEGQVLPDLDDAFRVEVASRYIELYERITGESFVPDVHPDPVSRVRDCLLSAAAAV